MQTTVHVTFREKVRSGIKDSLFEETCPQNKPGVFHLQNQNQEAEKLPKSNLWEPQTENSSQISGAQHWKLKKY